MEICKFSLSPIELNIQHHHFSLLQPLFMKFYSLFEERKIWLLHLILTLTLGPAFLTTAHRVSFLSWLNISYVAICPYSIKMKKYNTIHTNISPISHCLKNIYVHSNIKWHCDSLPTPPRGFQHGTGMSQVPLLTQKSQTIYQSKDSW